MCRTLESVRGCGVVSIWGYLVWRHVGGEKEVLLALDWRVDCVVGIYLGSLSKQSGIIKLTDVVSKPGYDSGPLLDSTQSKVSYAACSEYHVDQHYTSVDPILSGFWNAGMESPTWENDPRRFSSLSLSRDSDLQV